MSLAVENWLFIRRIRRAFFSQHLPYPNFLKLSMSGINSPGAVAALPTIDINTQSSSRSRFWIRSFDYKSTSQETSDEQLLNGVVSSIKSNSLPRDSAVRDPSSSVPLSLSEFGLIFVPALDAFIPVHDGIPQTQHTVRVPGRTGLVGESSPSGDGFKVVVCGFSRRAQGVVTDDPEDLEGSASRPREVNKERLEALSVWLPRLCEGMTVDALFGSEEFLGTSPSRIARSFVAPRANRIQLPMPVDRQAKQAAEQIVYAVRALRADRAEHLKNLDRPAPVPSTDKRPSRSFIDDDTASPHAVVLVLDNLRSAFNVGSLFRTADTAGLRGVITAGISPHPPLSEKLRKTGFQAIDSVATEHFDDVMSAVKRLKAAGYFIVALEITDGARRYDQIPYRERLPLAVVVGNEISGVDTRVLQAADAVAHIPTFGLKNSLNVAAAAPIMLFEIVRQLQSG